MSRRKHIKQAPLPTHIVCNRIKRISRYCCRQFYQHIIGPISYLLLSFAHTNMASPRANKSRVWEHITKLSTSKVKCNICSKELALSKSGSTSTLHHHLRAMHPSIHGVGTEVKITQPSLEAFGVSATRPCSDSRQEKITSLLVSCIVDNMLPLSLVEDEAFRELITYLEQQNKIPCRVTVCARLSSHKSDLAKTVAEEMAATPAVHLTMDIWLSISNDAYLDTHHTLRRTGS